MHRTAIDLITGLEDAIDTNAITYGGIGAWPYCRLKLWSHLMAEGFKEIAGPDAATITNTGPQFRDYGQTEIYQAGDPELGLIHCDSTASAESWKTSTESPDLMFFLRPEEHRDTFEGKPYAKILDSLFDRFSAFSRIKVEWADPATMGFPRKNPSLFFYGNSVAQLAISDPPFDLENFDPLDQALVKVGLENVLSKGEVTIAMDKILQLSRLFDVMLSRIMPKAIFLTFYCHHIGMGLVLAARRLGIPTIDVQHGRLGPYHGLYTQLTAAPADGYDIAPDKIWCWGAQTKRDIDIDLNPACSRHSGIIGGNPWLERWLSQKTNLPDSIAAEDLLRRHAGQKKIIVSLQPISQPLPKFVLEAMKRAPKNWSWWIRTHPLRQHTTPELKNLLSENGVSNYEIEDTTTLPLFWLLQNSDHHLTSFSSVAIEALAFCLRTTVFSQIGLTTFKGYVEQRHFEFADTAESLIEKINKALQLPPPTEDKPFIDTSPGIAEAAVSAIVN